MQPEQTVAEMVDEVLGRQAEALADRTGEPLEGALETVLNSEAGEQLSNLRDGTVPTPKRASKSGRSLWPRSGPRSGQNISENVSARPRSTLRTADEPKLPRTPSRRSSENSPSTHSGE